jgi:hypothetical protein
MRNEIPESFTVFKTITNLKINSGNLFYLNYLHMVYQNPTIASFTVKTLFPSISKTSSVKLSFKELNSLFEQKNLSNTKTSAIIKILTNSTTCLTIFLALALNHKDFISYYLKFDPSVLSTNFQLLKDCLEKKSSSLNVLKDNDTLNPIISKTSNIAAPELDKITTKSTSSITQEPQDLKDKES